MSNLMHHLQQQLEGHIANLRENLTTHTARATAAGSLAQKLQSQGLQALAAGRIDGHHILMWVSVTATYPTLSNALVRLDLIERERFVTSTDCEIYVAGFDVPIYLTRPTRERNSFEQALHAAIADRKQVRA